MDDFGYEFKNQLLVQRIFTGPFTDVLFMIGSKDQRIQDMVSEAMSESNERDIEISRLALRTLFVCLREALKQ
jgi:hypothetical protein